MTTFPVEFTPTVAIAIFVCTLIFGWLFACCVVVVRREKE